MAYRDWNDSSAALTPLFIEVTCAEVTAMIAAGTVSVGQHYVVTDYNLGTVGPATILTTGVRTDRFASDVSVRTNWSAKSWAGEWDQATCRLYALHDDKGNRVYGRVGTEVESFPWNDTNVTQVTVANATFTVSGGVVHHIMVSSGASLTISGGVAEGLDIGSNAVVNVAAAGHLWHTQISGHADVNVTGTGELGDCVIGAATVATNRLRIVNSSFETGSNLTTVNAAGQVDRCEFRTGAVADVSQCSSVDITDTEFVEGGRLVAVNARSILVERCNIASIGYVLVVAGANLVMVDSEVSTEGLVRSLRADGTLTMLRSEVSYSGRIDHDSPNNNFVDQTQSSHRHVITFADDSRDCGILYSTCTDVGVTMFRGTSRSSQLTRSTSSGTVDIRSSNNVRLFRNDLGTRSRLAVINGSDGFDCEYLDLRGDGRLVARNGSVGRLRGVVIGADAYLRLWAHRDWIRESSFFSGCNYYLTGNTATKRGLHLYGPGIYTEPNPGAAVTGAQVRNW